jgi:hypothetical protein
LQNNLALMGINPAATFFLIPKSNIKIIVFPKPNKEINYDKTGCV